jgi:hypothetical protein
MSIGGLACLRETAVLIHRIMNKTAFVVSWSGKINEK